MKFTMTQDTITVLKDGKSISVAYGAPNWSRLRAALLHACATDLDTAWEEVERHLTPRKSLAAYASDNFTISEDGDNAQFSYNGEALPVAINKRIVNMATEGKDPAPLLKFYERLQLNPSSRSVEQLFPFLDHQGIPLTDDGCFLAYKGVKANYQDQYTGTIDNTPGVVNELPRNKISDDPNTACHFGYHVGALSYAQSFVESGGRIVVCEVDPRDVVCVPYDESQRKMRVCRYKVIGNHNGEYMADTVFNEQDGTHIPDSERKAAAPKKKKDKKRARRAYQKMAKMKMGDLMKQPIEALRGYASGWLKIVGASKIPGGKTALVSQILKARKRGK